MDIQSYNPVNEKIKRIEQLEKWGFNTPRLLYLPKATSYNKESVELFLEKHKDLSKLNIRTYSYDPHSKQEGYSSKHYVGLSPKKIVKTLDEIISERYCMIDAEIPSDGLYAGNIAIEPKNYCTIEWFHGKKAMVRMANQSDSGYVENLVETFKEKHQSLIDIMNTAFTCPKTNIVLEWSVLKVPGGIKKEKLIWWEWRHWISQNTPKSENWRKFI